MLHPDLEGDPRQNRLLAALPADAWERWQPHLTAVDMPLGKVIFEPGDRMPHVYFPATSIVVLMQPTDDGASTQIAAVGSDGIIGVALFMSGGSAIYRWVVQAAGKGFTLPAHLPMQEFNRAGPVMHLLLRYTQAMLTQMGQTAVCNRHHLLEQQLCRWLLSLDRLPGNELLMTQELIANTLGVRREGVTAAAARLQAAGLIRYQRGRITVLDRAGLEQRSCECYATVKREYERLLPAETAR